MIHCHRATLLTPHAKKIQPNLVLDTAFDEEISPLQNAQLSSEDGMKILFGWVGSARRDMHYSRMRTAFYGMVYYSNPPRRNPIFTTSQLKQASMPVFHDRYVPSC
jgi:hypothetical protein